MPHSAIFALTVVLPLRLAVVAVGFYRERWLLPMTVFYFPVVWALALLYNRLFIVGGNAT